MLTSSGRRLSRYAVSPRPRMRNYTLGNMPPPPAVNIRTHDMISPQERSFYFHFIIQILIVKMLFLEAAERGDKPTLQDCLLTPKNIIHFCRKRVVDLLLRHPDIRIGNALLCAIREVNQVTMIIEIEITEYIIFN
uniref:Ankyrin repeat protein n=1 Tax=Heterorhabditis bacteriophora TaxID=37862 RepID=A0A1I7WEV2_HETBA